MEKSKELVGIETLLRLQLNKHNERIKDGLIDIVSFFNVTRKIVNFFQSAARGEESYLQKRFKDTDFLRKISARREIDYDKELVSFLKSFEF